MIYPEQTDNYNVDTFNGNFLELSVREQQLGVDLGKERERAKAAEKANSDAISAEESRASAQEAAIDSKYAAEAQAIRALIDAAYASANGYTDNQIAGLINGAPSTLDTLGEIAQAMQDNADVVAALDEAIGRKASAAELDSHVKDKANPHAVTKAQLGLGNVDNTADASKYVMGIIDYNDPSGKIQIGFSGAGLSANAVEHVAAYTDGGHKIKDLSIANLKAKMGLNNVSNTADADKSVSYASSAGNADTVDGVHFSWSGKTGQPTWLWGCNDGGTSYVWNPLNFNVNYANSAGNADTVDGFHASGSHSDANTCVVRDGNGFTNLFYINSSTPANEQSAISQIITTNGTDNYYRKVSVQRMKSAIGLGNVDNTADANKSVNYANSAGSVAYGNVTGRPTFSLSGSTLTINF